MTAQTEGRQQATEQLLSATDEALKAGLNLPCLATYADVSPWLSEDEQIRAEAVSACRACPVITECLGYAQAHRTTFGVYGGRDFTVTQRKVAS